jgi:hypothetical protein
MNKVQLKEHIEKIISYVGQEYNHGPKLVMNESKEPVFISEGMFYHIENNLPLNESIYRPQSAMFLKLFVEARNLYENKRLVLCEADQYYFDNTDIGTFGIYESFEIGDKVKIKKEYGGGSGTIKDINKSFIILDNGKSYHESDLIPMKEGIKVPLDLPLTEEFLTEVLEEEKKQPAIGKPKRGGSKKFYVYVKNPKTKKIKKVSFGMAGGGLRAKLNNPKARAAFSKRHNCPQKKDKTKASYWSCRLPRYAKLLGFKTTFSGYW